MQTVWGVATDAGGRRTVNEDAVLAEPPVFLVADGMGGHVHGSMASTAVVEAFTDFARSLTRGQAVQPADVLGAVADAQARIRQGLRTDNGAAAPAPGERGPTAGSTVAGAVLTHHEGSAYWLVFNIGDSRIYRYDEHGLAQISTDHSVVQELLDAGAIDLWAARRHPQRNIITRAVGSGEDVEPDFWMLRANSPQRLLLCSDGLVTELSDQHLGAALGGGGGPQWVAQQLLQDAVADGARDNVSLVVVDLIAERADISGDTAPSARNYATRQHWHNENEDTVPRMRSGL